MAEPTEPPPLAPPPRPLPADFFGAVVPGNPVVDSLEAELRDVLGFLRRLRGTWESEPQRHELHRRGANALFNTWIRYKPRLPDWYYNDKLVEVGDSLTQIKEYKLALTQCYGRYLQQFCSVNPDDIPADENQLKSTFFPNGFRDENAALTFHALQERNVCVYQMVCSNDRNLQKQESLQACFKVLSSLRLTMQVALPQQNLCWLVYNGTIHIYTICRHLMTIGQSAKVLEYLLWASVCMELSIPLLSVHYLTWRATLYAAVSQCYYDCQAGIHGEVFARRGLLQIDELKQLENISSSQTSSETEKIFREATIKMSVMIFKRAVFESRRKPKSQSRTKLRVSLKESQNVSLTFWPRTTTERLLTEMFDGTAAQFLAILEALSDSSRRVLHPTPPVPDEPEICDVISELLLAGLEILSGAQTSIFLVFPCCERKSLVSGEAAVKFVKLAFNYEEWDVFDPAIEFQKKIWVTRNCFKKYFLSFQNVVSSNHTDKYDHGYLLALKTFKSVYVQCMQICFYNCVLFFFFFNFQNILPDKEILFDVLSFLWQKCKTGLQLIQTNGSGYFKYNHKHKASKWVRVLWIINEVILQSNVADTDVVMVAEITLCLTAILESMADSSIKSKKNAGKAFKKKMIMGSHVQNLSSDLEWSSDRTRTGNHFLMDLHLELIQAQHRIAVKILKLTQEADIMGKIKKNKLSRAIFLMEKAVQVFPKDLSTSSQRQLLKEALTLIEQVEAEQSALYHSLKEFKSGKKKSKIPPPPLLLSRSHCSMTFKPASFSSDVAWYTILGCVAGENNQKVRLNHNKLPNAGEEIPADGKSLLEIQDLDPNEEYIFAVAAYSSDGKLIGNATGETTRPILAYPPLSATIVRAYLTQAAYQTGNYMLAKGAFSPMWDYFVSNSSALPTNAAVISARSTLTISEKRLRFEVICQTSPITLYLFLRNIFVICDINIMEGTLFCDSICCNEILYKEQVSRLAQCERMSVAIELSSFLNDASYALQSVVQCYGLLAPLIYHKISAVPVVQILIKCLAVLQEIPNATLQRRQEGCYESIQHMIACTSFYTAKVLRSWKEYELAVVIVNYGKKLLGSSQTTTPGQPGAKETEEARKIKVTTLIFIFFFFFYLNIKKCYYCIAVMKFKKQSRFLEFFIQVLHKILNEEQFHSVLEWAENIFEKNQFHFFFCYCFLKNYFRKHMEELEKLAHKTLVILLKPIVSNYLNRKQFHQICLEEMPWRSQMNIYLAIAHYNLFTKKLEEQYNIGICGSHHQDRYVLLSYQCLLLILIIVLLPLMQIDMNNSIISQLALLVLPRLYHEKRRLFISVLAHRGGHWTLLQNACRELWNYTQESQSIANHSYSHKDAFPITRQFLRNTVWLPFYLASDMLIDMITELQASNSLKPEGDFCIPSCLGGTTSENGGSNLHPQSPLDDVNVVDLKWICNLILKTLEFLYKMKKWEALVHIALQFNVFTHERYTEQVSPLLVYAQRQLLERIQQFSGPDSNESHFTNCRDYIGQNLQPPVAHSDSILVFSDGSEAKPTVYVPLDVNDALKCFRETLQKSKYHSRALRHSRKLLSLFLASTQEILDNQRDLKVQALHELGNLHFYAGNKRAAFKYWCQALDETLNTVNILNTWQELDFPKNTTECFAVGRSTNISQKFLSQAGIWGCLHAAVLVAKIAQYVTTSNVRLRTKYCHFSAILFKTLFRASLPHPTSDCDFAQYETHMLIPGIDLFSDRYRADISTVVASLNFLMFELHCAKRNLTILPLFTLYQYFVSEICKDPTKSIEGRIFKIKVLTDLGFFTEAFNELYLLNYGERIPWKIPAGYKQNEEMKNFLYFDSSKPLLNSTNLQVLEDIFNWSLSLTIVPLCNQQIMNKLILAKMHFIICLSATINNIPEKVEKCIYSVDGKTPGNVKGNSLRADPCVEDDQETHSAIAQDHLNIHLWQRCRRMLVTALATQLRHVGDKEDSKSSNYIVFFLSMSKQNIISLLQEDKFISPPASLTLVKSMLLMADMLELQRAENMEYCSSAVEPLNILNLAHEITLKEIFFCGECIEQQIEDRTLSCLILPAKNIYLPYINLLAQVKMRIGNTLAERVACTPEREDPLQWLPALKHLETALKLCRASATKVLDMEAQLLFQIVVASQLLIGMENVKERNVEDAEEQKIPEFASMDLLASYIDYFYLLGIYFPVFQIPFDITLQSIASLEDMFDLANGCTITEESLFSWIISLFQ
uniref:Cilia and flagella associated protein 54 n=1 Tax=Coturnix japonica TaxID=93934 RepID=A0A8C2SZF3_COTJA